MGSLAKLLYARMTAEATVAVYCYPPPKTIYLARLSVLASMAGEDSIALSQYALNLVMEMESA